MIRDANGDGKISDSDKVYTSGTVPLASGGWAHEIIWKNFDLNLLFVYTINRHIINMFSRHSLYSDGDYPVFYDYSGLSFWEKRVMTRILFLSVLVTRRCYVLNWKT